MFFFFEFWELLLSAWEELLIDITSEEPAVESALDEERCRLLAGIIYERVKKLGFEDGITKRNFFEEFEKLELISKNLFRTN